MMSNNRWSSYQQAVFADFAEDEGHTVVEAVAGSGKTTTVVEGMNHVPRSKRVLFCAFNKAIQRELARRIHGTDVKTLHALGLLASRRAFGDITLDENKGKDLARQVCIDGDHFFVNRKKEKVPLGWRKVAKLAGLIKNTLTPIDGGDPEAEAEARILVGYLATEHWLDDDPKTIPPDKLIDFAIECVRQAADDKVTLDFDDMVWFPARFELRPASHDVIIVDETQDLNAAQLYLAQALCKKNGRIVAVGDRNQSIYGFRGADSEAIDRMIGELKAKVLPLSICYRCPKDVVRLANEVVPQIEAAPDASPGVVRLGVDPELMKHEAQPGDLVLSRTKAPLTRLALGFLAQGKPTVILGRDIGKQLVDLMEKSKTESVPEMNRWIDAWRQKEVARLRELERDEQVEEVNDRAATIFCLSEGLAIVPEVVARTQTMFADRDEKTKIVCSTVHKAKGLERPRVWMIGETFKLWQGDRYQEERNLYYVAVTRAQQELAIVGEVQR